MKQILFYVLSFVFLTGCGEADNSQKKTNSISDNTKTAMVKESSKDAEPILDSATMVANWQAYMKPGEMHDMMKSWNGNWKQEVTAWEYQGAEPQTSRGNTLNEMILGGRYQRSTSSGTMMGMPFQGIGTTSYDNAKKTFKMSWIDNVGTGMFVMEGPWDEISKSMSLAGSMVDPASAEGKEIPVREVYKIEDEKHHTMQMFMPGKDGKEFMMMEMKLTRL